MKKSKNLKGFTLVEEVVSLAILSILILVASGMMIAAMRVYSVNVKTQSAQNKGQYVYDLLDEKLTYASGLQYQKNISTAEDSTEFTPLNPPNDTYFKGGEVKKIFSDDEVYQEIKVDKNGIVNSFNNKKIDFGQYDVDVSLELETETTSSVGTPTAENAMLDKVLFDLVSNSEVTDSAGSLTPQGEVSFLGGLEMMNQTAEVKNVSNIGDSVSWTRENDYYLINNIPINVTSLEITVTNNNPSNWLGMYYYKNSTGQYNQQSAFNEQCTTKTFYIELKEDTWLKLMNADGYKLDSVKIDSLQGNYTPLVVTYNGDEYTKDDSIPNIDLNVGSELSFTTNEKADVKLLYYGWDNNFPSNKAEIKSSDEKTFTISAKNIDNSNNDFRVVISKGTEKIVMNVFLKPYPLTVTIDGEDHSDDFSINIGVGAENKKEVTFGSLLPDNVEKICYNTYPADLKIDASNHKVYIVGKNSGQSTEAIFRYGGKQINVRINVVKDGDPFKLTGETFKDICVDETYQLTHNKINNGKIDDGYTVNYSSADETVATVDENGLITGKSAGKTTITATAVHNYLGKEITETNEFTINVSEPISVDKNEITVFAGDKFSTLPFKIQNSTNYDIVVPWEITFDNNGGMSVDKNLTGDVTVTFRDKSNNSTANIKINVVQFTITEPTDMNVKLQKGESLTFKSNYGQDGISRGVKKFSFEIADTSLLTDESNEFNSSEKIVKASDNKTGTTTVKIKFGEYEIKTYNIEVVEKAKTLKLDNSDADSEITLWAGEEKTFEVSSTLENFNSLNISGNSDNKLNITTSEDLKTLTIKALRAEKNEDVDLEISDVYHKVEIDNTVTQSNGVPIKIKVHIKVPQINTENIVMYPNETREISTGDVPTKYFVNRKSSLATLISVSSEGNIVLSSGNQKGTSKITITYTCNDVTYTFEINVTVTDRLPETTTTTTAEPVTTTTSTTTTTTSATTNTGEPMSKYRFKLNVTVKDKKGKEIYNRSGSISVMNYESTGLSEFMKVKRFPSTMDINNTTDNGFILKIYYID